MENRHGDKVIWVSDTITRPNNMGGFYCVRICAVCKDDAYNEYFDNVLFDTETAARDYIARVKKDLIE